MSDILNTGRLVLRILWSLLLLYFMTNLVIIFFGRMLPHLIFGQQEIESKMKVESEMELK